MQIKSNPLILVAIGLGFTLNAFGHDTHREARRPMRRNIVPNTGGTSTTTAQDAWKVNEESHDRKNARYHHPRKHETESESHHYPAE